MKPLGVSGLNDMIRYNLETCQVLQPHRSFLGASHTESSNRFSDLGQLQTSTWGLISSTQHLSTDVETKRKTSLGALWPSLLKDDCLKCLKLTDSVARVVGSSSQRARALRDVARLPTLTSPYSTRGQTK